MESPQLYDNSDYKKVQTAVKVKGPIYHNEDYPPELAELSAPEISLDLRNLIDDSQFNDDNFHLAVTGIEGLSVDNNSAPRGLGVNNMYNPLPYVPTPVHSAAQFDRGYSDRSLGGDRAIKEEPNEHDVAHHEYAPCARGGDPTYSAASGYHGPISYATMTPTTVPGADLCRSPLKSPSAGKIMPGCKKNMDKGSDEYKRRRERNNIAVRKSREKAKARTRETEERVKKLMMDNDRLAKKCDQLSKEVAVFHSMFANLHLLPEHVQREFRKQMDAYGQQHQHLVNM